MNRSGVAMVAMVLLVSAGCGGRPPGGGATSSTSPVVSPPQSTVSSPTSSPESTTVFPGIWPFASQAEADTYDAGTDTTFRDPATTASEFAVRYLGLAGAVTFAPVAAKGVVDVPVGPGRGEGGPLAIPRPTFTVSLLSTSPGNAGPWTVVGARAPEITVDQPAPLDTISSPTALRGSALAFEGTVNVVVRQDAMLADQSLGEGVVTGGGSEQSPFSGQVNFRRPTKPAGAVVFFEQSAADGQGLLRATVVRVAFDPSSSPA